MNRPVRVGWRGGTRAFIVGITLITIAIALAFGSRSSGTTRPARPHGTVTLTGLPCRTATIGGSSLTLCEESTPVSK